MATEDDTFDIDIYGDDPSDAQQAEAQVTGGDAYKLDFSTTNDEDANQPNSAPQATGGSEINNQKTEQQATRDKSSEIPNTQQGTKRKALDDDHDESIGSDSQRPGPVTTNSVTSLDTRPTSAADPYAMPALRLTELQWWITEEDLRSYCAKAGVEDQLKELSFGEHKINGKSRGEAYLEFESSSAAEKVKNGIDKAIQASANESGAKRKDWLIEFTHVGNNFKMAASSSAPKKDHQQSNYNRGGYNNSDRGGYNNRGNFRGGGFQNRGNFNNTRGGMYQQSNPSQGGWGGGNGMMPNMGGGDFNPMMGMNMMGGFNNMGMNQGGGMPMMNMNRGGMMGMNMMGRGGWNGGFQGQGNGMGQQGWQDGGGSQQGHKRTRME